MPLNAENRRIADAARELARHSPELKAVGQLAQAQEDAAVADLLAKARQEAEGYDRSCRRQEVASEQEEKGARHELERAERAMEREKHLLEATRKIDAYLARGGSVQGRIAEGRQSLTRFKLDRHLSELMEARAVEKRGQLQVAIRPEQLRRIQESLSEGQRGWVVYVLQEAQRDLQMEIHGAWLTLDGDLPLQPPELPALAPPWEREGARPWWDAPEPPDPQALSHLNSVWAELFRTVRQQAFPLAALIGLAGLGADRRYSWLMAIFLLIPIGWFVVQRDRQRRIEELAERGRREASAELQRWVEARLDRTANKLRDEVIYQLQGPTRAAWVQWYRQDVLPRQAQAAERLQRARAALEQARASRQEILRRLPKREIERFLGVCPEA